MINRDYLAMLETFVGSSYPPYTPSRSGPVKKILKIGFECREFPLLSMRRIGWKTAIEEMEWFLSGDEDISSATDNVLKWWQPWLVKNKLEHGYGKQFRRFQGATGVIDQVQYLINLLKQDPQSRRALITTWNTADVLHCSLPPCHGSLIHLDIDHKNRLTLIMDQRSADLLIGVPHNLVQYWALLLYLADKIGVKAKRLMWVGNIVHLYKEIENDAITLSKTDMTKLSETPKLIYTPTSDEFKASDFSLEGDYKPLVNMKIKVIV